MLLDPQSSLDEDIFHECLLLYRQQISVFVKECDEICHIGHNESSEFITI